ncbi:MAG: hypothetical protein AAFQ80_17705 [Cyanobacteria bacterium J06621_8]
MINQSSENLSFLDIPHTCCCMRHQLYQQGLYLSLKDLENAYYGTYQDLDNFIAEGINDSLYALLLNAYTVDDTAPGFVSFKVDVGSFPRSGQFVYITGESGQIHVFKVTA